MPIDETPLGDRRRGLRTANAAAADIFMLEYGQGRPTKAGEEYNVYFMGVDPGSTRQRFAFGLSSFNIGREGTGVPQSQFDFPDGDGNNDYLPYSFWSRPDASFTGNWMRTKTVNQSAVATSGAGEH